MVDRQPMNTREPLVDEPRWRHLRQPGRLLAIAGSVVVIVGALLPWARITDLAGVEIFDGISGVGDGILESAIAIATIVLLVLPVAANARVRPMQLLPFVPGPAMLIVALSVTRMLDVRLGAIAAVGGTIEMLPGYNLLVAGAVAVSVGGAWIVIAAVRADPRPGGGGLRIGRAAATTLAQVLGAVAGAVLGPSVVGMIVPVSSSAVGATLGATLISAFAGAVLGALGVGALVRRAYGDSSGRA
jgi:hypothetical protein